MSPCVCRYYSTSIFCQIGVREYVSTALVGTLNFFTTFLSIVLVDKVLCCSLHVHASIHAACRLVERPCCCWEPWACCSPSLLLLPSSRYGTWQMTMRPPVARWLATWSSSAYASLSSTLHMAGGECVCVAQLPSELYWGMCLFPVQWLGWSPVSSSP